MQQSNRNVGRINQPPTSGLKLSTSDRRALGRSLRYLFSYKRATAGALFSLLLMSAANLVVPLIIQRAIDSGVGKHDFAVIAGSGLALIAVAMIRGLFTFLQGYLAERASQGVAYDLREALFNRIQKLSFSYYDQVETGQLLTRLTNDVEQIRQFAGRGVIQMIAASVMLIGVIVLLLYLNWRLALVSLLIVPPVFVALLYFVRRVGPMFLIIQQSLSRLNTILQEDIAGVRVIRSFLREDYEYRRYSEANDDLLAKNNTVIGMFSNNFPLVFFFANLGTLIVIWFGGYQVTGGQLSIGTLVAFNSFLTFLIQPVLQLGFLSSLLSRAGASSVRVFEIIDAPLDIQDRPGAVDLEEVSGRVEFQNVHFRYPGSEREVLHGVTFTAEPGQTVAILGTLGSGKSSLVNLIPRFYDVTEGSVKVDGRDVRDVTLASLRRQTGIVLPDALLFSGTVRDNIRYGRLEASDEEIESAARAAQAEEFILRLPEGYDTIVGERGVGLSGGQRQRIAIARALLIEPKLLILDDSMSAVDAQTESLLQDALERLMRSVGNTSFVIAQRASTVRNADLIVIIDDGRVAASGTHEELLEGSELYNEILGSQLIRDERQVAASERG